MKNTIKLSVLALVTIATILQTNTLYAQKNAAKFNFFNVGKIGGTVEHAFSSKNSFVVGFDKWNQKSNHNSTATILAYTESVSTSTHVTGYRIDFLARHYAKKALNGGFVEGGFYTGKHKIVQNITTTYFNTVALFFWDLENVTGSETTTKTYKDVIVTGGKIGGGYAKNLKNISLECSGGISFNAVNSKNIRPTLPFKGASPYARIMLGVAF